MKGISTFSNDFIDRTKKELDDRNAAVSGVERDTGKSLDGKPIYEMYLKTPAQYTTTTNGVWTIGTGLKILGAIYVGANTYVFNAFTANGTSTAYSQYLYHTPTGAIDADVSTYTILAGTVIHFEYTK